MYKYCVAAMESNRDESNQYHAAFYAVKSGYGLHKVGDINDEFILWYDTEKEAKQHRLNSNDCVISKWFEDEIKKSVTWERCKSMWEQLNKFKDSAEQAQFPFLLMMDVQLVPAYEDLEKNWNEEHAEIFIKAMKQVFQKLGIKEGGGE